MRLGGKIPLKDCVLVKVLGAAQHIRSPTVLAEDQSLVPNIHKWHRKFLLDVGYLWPQRAPAFMCTCPQTHTHLKKKKSKVQFQETL